MGNFGISNEDPYDYDVMVRKDKNDNALAYGTWIQKNCIVSRNGFRLLPDLKSEISNEKAYELYFESLKSK